MQDLEREIVPLFQITRKILEFSKSSNIRTIISSFDRFSTAIKEDIKEGDVDYVMKVFSVLSKYDEIFDENNSTKWIEGIKLFYVEEESRSILYLGEIYKLAKHISDLYSSKTDDYDDSQEILFPEIFLYHLKKICLLTFKNISVEKLKSLEKSVENLSISLGMGDEATQTLTVPTQGFNMSDVSGILNGLFSSLGGTNNNIQGSQTNNAQPIDFSDSLGKFANVIRSPEAIALVGTISTKISDCNGIESMIAQMADVISGKDFNTLIAKVGKEMNENTTEQKEEKIEEAEEEIIEDEIKEDKTNLHDNVD